MTQSFETPSCEQKLIEKLTKSQIQQRGHLPVHKNRGMHPPLHTPQPQ